MESELKQLIEENINNEIIFTKIYELSKKYLQITKKVKYAIIDEISSIIAEDLYMKILKGDKIEFWISYISKYYYSALNSYIKMFSPEIIDTNNNYDLHEAIIKMCNSNPESEIDYFCDSSFLNYIPNIINNILDNSRYNKEEIDYLNAKMSLLLSLTFNKCVYFKIKNPEKMYINYLYSLLKNALYKYIKENSSSEALEQNLSLLQLYTLSIGDIYEQHR